MSKQSDPNFEPGEWQTENQGIGYWKSEEALILAYTSSPTYWDTTKGPMPGHFGCPNDFYLESFSPEGKSIDKLPIDPNAFFCEACCAEILLYANKIETIDGPDGEEKTGEWVIEKGKFKKTFPK